MRQSITKTLCVTWVLCLSMNLFGQNSAGSDPKLTPSLSGGNQSIGSIYAPNIFEGSANINIPIYQRSSAVGEIGVSLSYNTKGVTVSELPSQAGLHWNINAGGGISRVLKDMPDDKYNPIVFDSLTDLSSTRGQWIHTVWPESNYRFNDREYDDFIVSFGNMSFTFNIGKNGSIFTHPHRDIKIEFTREDTDAVELGPPYFQDSIGNFGFKITDEQGNQFWFNKGEQADMDLYDNMSPVNSNIIGTLHYTTRWNISKVLLADGNTIHYIYSNRTVNEVLYNNFSSREFLEPMNGFNYSAPYSNPVEMSLQQGTISSLDSIIYSDGVTVNFAYNMGTDYPCLDEKSALKEITVISGNNCIRYQLKHAYSLAKIPNKPNMPAEIKMEDLCANYDTSGLSSNDFKWYRRLILKGVDIQSCDRTKTEHYYTFEYSPIRLPFRLSGAQDYFGYYNGQQITANEGQLTIPLHQVIFGNTSFYGVNKTNLADSAKAGILTKVKNAYGGSISFEYEAHHLTNVLTGLPTDFLFMGADADDGIRLKSMTERDTFWTGGLRKTTFTYSGGQRFLTGGYFHYPERINGQGVISSYTFGGIYVSQHQFLNGSNHGYSEVTTEVRIQDNSLLSRRVQEFTNFKDASSNNQPRYLLVGGSKNYYDLPYTNKQYIKDWEIGLPLSTTDYDQNNKILGQTINIYNFSLDTAQTIGLFENVHMLKVANSSLAYNIVNIDSDSYRPFTGKALLSKTITKKFISDAIAILDTVSYSYDSKNNLKTLFTKDSKGVINSTNYIYNYEISGPNIPPPGGLQTGILYDMTSKGLQKLISTERWSWKINPNNSLYIKDKLLNANISVFGMQNGHYNNKLLFNLSVGEPVPFLSYTAQGEYGKILTAYYTTNPLPEFQKLSEVMQFDEKSNPLQTRLGTQDAFVSMIWDTFYMKKTAEVVNAEYKDIAYTSFEKTFLGEFTGMETVEDGRFSYRIGSRTGTNKFTGHLGYALNSVMSSFVKTPELEVGKAYMFTFWAKGGIPTLQGLGISSIVPILQTQAANGWSLYKVVITPLTVGELTVTGDNITIDELRLFPVGAQMTSSTYEPLYGVSSVTDVSGRIIFKEYDKFGRLTTIRDQDGNILSYTQYYIN